MTKVLKFVGLVLAVLLEWLLIFVIIGVFAIRSSSVQTYLAKRAAHYLSDELGTKVDVGALDIVLFRYIDLKHLYIEDQSKKPLLKLRHLYVGIDELQLLKNKFKINTLRLYSGKLNLERSKKNGQYNFAFIQNYFSPKKSSPTKQNFEVDLSDLQLAHIDLQFHDLRKKKQSGRIDFNHLKVNDLLLHATNVHANTDAFKCQIKHLKFQEQSGLGLRDLNGYMFYSSKGIVLRKGVLQTSKSKLYFPKLALRTKQSSDFEAFYDKVEFDIEVAPSQLCLDELSLFAPELRGMDQSILIAGKIHDKLSNLQITDLNLRFGQESVLKAQLHLPDFRDLSTQMLLTEQINSAHISLADLAAFHLPDGYDPISIPDYLQKANKIDLKNAKLFGHPNQLQIEIQSIKSDLGQVALAPIKLVAKDGKYTIKGVADSSFVTLTDFNLGHLTDQKMLGKMNGKLKFELSIDQKGAYALTKGDALLSSLVLNAYNYQNISISDLQVLNQELIAKLEVHDPHLDLSSVLQLNLGTAPSYQVKMDLNRADLHPLNLSSIPNNQISAELNFGLEGPNWNTVVGFVSLKDYDYSVESQHIKGELAQIHYRKKGQSTTLNLSSTLLDFSLDGILDEKTLIEDLRHHLAILYPPIDNQERSFLHTAANFQFNLLVRQPSQLLAIFVPDLHVAKGTNVSGSFHSMNEELQINIQSPELKYANASLKNLNMKQNIFHDKTQGELDINELTIADSTKFHSLSIKNIGAHGIQDATLSWDPNTNDYSEIKWRTTVLPQDYVSLTLQPSFFTINGVQWKIANQSDITFSSRDVSVSDFEMYRGFQRILLKGCLSENKRDQLRFDVFGLDLSELSSLLDLPNDYSGRFTGWGTIATPFTNLNISADANIEQLQIDEQTVGDIMLHSDWNDARQSIALDGTLQYRNERTFAFDGRYQFKNDELDLGLNFKQTDISFANAFLDPEVVKGIKGKLDGRLKLNGSPSHPELTGRLQLQNGGAEISILGVNYQIEGQIQVTEDAFFIDNAPIRDPEGNLAYLSSAVNHQNFDQWNYDIQINFEDDLKKFDPRTNQLVPLDKFLVLNTKYKEGDVYYGKAYGRGVANIFGTANYTEITVDATTRKGTEVIFPMYGMSEIDDDDNFVQFIDRNIAAPIEQKTKEYSGLALDLNFHVTSDANMKLIFNDQTGDEIIAKGAGDLNIKLDQFNQLTMNGPYVISGGSRYNFALGSIKQTFDIESGSKIEWTGDPYNADISINTVTPKRASILELSPEIQDNTLVNQEILCYLKLSETLLQPKITFDLIAPRTTETGKALIDRVKTDPDELNRQFFSLLLVSKFQPLKGSLSAGGSAALDLLESQINAALGKLSDNYKLNLDYGSDDNAGESKVELGVAKGFLDDKLVITGSFGVENKTTSGANGAQSYANSMIGDVNIEYKIQDNFRVRAFNQSNSNSVNENQGPFTQGFGVSYYEEFHRFSDLVFVKQLRQFLKLDSKKPGAPALNKHRQPVTLPQDEKSTSSQPRRNRSSRASHT